MNEPREISELERDWVGVLRANVYTGLFAVFSVAYFVLAAWLATGATEAWGQNESLGVICVFVGLYLWLLLRMVRLRRKLVGTPRGERLAAEGVCGSCGYDLKGLGVGAVCPECGAGRA